MAAHPDPIGLNVSRTGRLLSRAFDDHLAASGGSLPVWLIAASLMRDDHTMQRDIASAVGIEGATLTHHLKRMEDAGLVARRRTPENRRSQLVELTDAGQSLFFTLLDAVVAFDRRLCAGFSRAELDTLRGYLERLRTNAATPPSDSPEQPEEREHPDARPGTVAVRPRRPRGGGRARRST